MAECANVIQAWNKTVTITQSSDREDAAINTHTQMKNKFGV